MTFWLAWRYMTSGKQLFNMSSFFVVGGMALGVACLVVAMSIFSGFETTLFQSIIDFTGHADIRFRGSQLSQEKEREFLNSLEALPGEIAGVTPYVEFPAAVAHKGHIAGVLLAGFEPGTVNDVLGFSRRLIDGEFDLTPGKTVIGRGLARKFSLEVGDKFRVIYPRHDTLKARQGFRSTIKTFQVAGIAQLGVHDYDSRFIIANIQSIRKLVREPRAIGGWRVKLKEEPMTAPFIGEFRTQYEYPYRIRSWRSENRTLVEAVQLEKPVIFFVLLIMVIAAGFNVCCHLFVGVMKRFTDISILKAMGAKRWQILAGFSLQGVVLGGVGAICGLALGVIFAHVFAWAQVNWELMPSEVYQLHLEKVELRVGDVFWIVITTLVISILSTLAPAWRGAKLKPVEGLRYE